jgi:SNF2 family DNA or RNA helicase
LNAARHVILLDDEWSPGMEDQAIGRIDRMNSTDQANVHIFRVKDSIDDFMASLIEEKRDVVEGFEGNFDKQRMIDHLRGN